MKNKIVLVLVIMFTAFIAPQAAKSQNEQDVKKLLVYIATQMVRIEKLDSSIREDKMLLQTSPYIYVMLSNKLQKATIQANKSYGNYGRGELLRSQLHLKRSMKSYDYVLKHYNTCVRTILSMPLYDENKIVTVNEIQKKYDKL